MQNTTNVAMTLAAFAALAGAGVAQASTPNPIISQASAPAPTQKASPGDDEKMLWKMVCKTEPPPTGTRLGSHRRCLTQFDWNELHRSARDQISHAPEWDPSGK